MFDYVIVGAGSAGCVLANRLSEDPAVRVLLVEAGGSDHDPRVSTPGLVGLLWRNRFDWQFFTAPQEHMDLRRMHWPRGKVLGGCSSTNYMIYMRGHRDNYDAWRDAGNPGWGYDDVLPLFKRSENNARGADAYHGAGGPLDVTDVAVNPLTDLIVEAAAEATSAPKNADFNGATQEGVGKHQATIRAGRRCSTSVAFLRPALVRPNLVVETQAQARGLVFERGRAVGVKYRKNGEVKTAHAAREVILSAGAVGSPHQLLLSGVGPADELRERGVGVIADVPGVGKNLHDHLFVGVAFEDKSGIANNVTPVNLVGWMARHTLWHTGPLASNCAEAGGFVRTQPGAPRPDLQFHFLPVGSDQVNFDEQAFMAKGRAFVLLATLIYPKSRGEIRLGSAEPDVPPVIDPRYFSDDADMRTLVDGVRIVQRISRAKPLERSRGKALWGAICTAEDDATLRAEIRRRCNTIFHPVGTCKMGPDSDPTAVVDSELRVRGVAGLRVVDASVMPTIVGGNTNAPTIMIAEKAAELIRAR